MALDRTTAPHLSLAELPMTTRSFAAQRCCALHVTCSVVLMALLMTFLLMACSSGGDGNATAAEQKCAAKLYQNYNEKALDQCMNVCKSCRGGNTVTCSTSCKLKGAS
jgi:hypothetical protein